MEKKYLVKVNPPLSTSIKSTMDSSIVFVVCSIFYLVSGGRWSLVLAAGTGFLVLKSKSSVAQPVTRSNISKAAEIEKQPKKESPIYAVDFTTTAPVAAAAVGAATATTTVAPKQIRSRAKRAPKIIKGGKPIVASLSSAQPHLTSSPVKLLESQVYIFYTTLTGSSQRIAKNLYEKISALPDLQRAPKLLSLDDDLDDLEEYFMKTPVDEKNPQVKNVYLLVLPSYEQDSPIDYFLEHLLDTYNDFRVDKYPLKSLLGFAVLGLGDSESWGKNQNFAIKLNWPISG